MASAWARAMVWLHSAEPVERVTCDFESWPRDQQTAFLIAIPLGSQTLALLEPVHEDVLKRFWDSGSPWARLQLRWSWLPRGSFSTGTPGGPLSS
jgi:hypothetical protein